MNLEERKQNFIRRARLIHGDKYDYSKIDYKNNLTKVDIICPEHGVFSQAPAGHLRGYGCNKCGYKKMVANSDYESRTKKSRETCLKKYGVENPMQVAGTVEKVRSTNLKKYGVKNSFQREEVREKSRKTCLEKYGVDSYSKTEECRERVKQTCFTKYGSDNFMKSPAADSVKSVIREKSIETCLEKYNSEHYSKSEDFKNKLVMRKAKEHQTKLINNSFNKSECEEALYDVLVKKFGKDDVFRNYKSEEYPFLCDFYIKSRNLYIELNAHVSHNKHWFMSDDEDAHILEIWKSKNTKYYDNLIETWTVRDVAKRNKARENNLNYVVFWDDTLDDANLWFAVGCPDGKDWKREYSWLPERDIINDINTNAYTTKVKSAHFEVFYKKELKLWKENKFYRGKRLHDFLYINRFKYLGKLPEDLSCFEILRGLNIAGIYKSFTAFDVTMMRSVIQEFDIKSVYDPCAGWGERMLLCNDLGVSYTGIDINKSLIPGYAKLMQSCEKVTFISGDSSDINLDNTFDALITCPPYGDVEIYSELGSENLEENEFKAWWERVINQAKDKVKYICIQTNQKYKLLFSDVIAGAGFDFIKEINQQKINHFNRTSTKREYESMLVFKKC